MVVNATQSIALFTGCDLCSFGAMRNIQVDGNRQGLGRLPASAALVEMGGNAWNQTIAK